MMDALAEANLIEAAMAQVAEEVDACFDTVLAIPEDGRARLYDAMRHAAIGGGKRLRPLLTIATAGLFNVRRPSAIAVGTAIEAIHVYSLIHDDLPAMDDDDMRRGKPTVHRAFDEATAILAGDSLLALAFEMLSSTETSADPYVRAELVQVVATASGPAGMAGGQMLDLAAAEGGYDLNDVAHMQALKTGALIAVSIEAGAILGHIPPEGRTHLRAYARDVGLAFQIADDILDLEGDEAKAGKALGKDDEAGKATFPGLVGIEVARARAHALVDQAVAHLASYGAEADLLRAIARYIVARDR